MDKNNTIIDPFKKGFKFIHVVEETNDIILCDGETHFITKYPVNQFNNQGQYEELYQIIKKEICNC